MSNKRFRQTTIHFRTSAGEDASIRDIASRNGVTVSAFARQCVLAATKGEGPSLAGAKVRELRKITAEMERIGLAARKRVITPLDAEKINFDLRRLHRTIFKFHYGEGEA